MCPLIDEKSYNLTKRTTKTEKFEKCLKMCIFLRDLSAIYGYLKNKIRQKQQFQEKKLSEKSVEGNKK